jgi:hypothetical protein
MGFLIEAFEPGTMQHAQFDYVSQLELKRVLMKLMNRYVKLIEAQANQLMPDKCRMQRRLRELLGEHPVLQQHGADAPPGPGLRLARQAEEYKGCGLDSWLFTNVYISIGSRTRRCHTDYRNPPVTHLTTRLLGDWGASPHKSVTGQTVLLDRYASRAIVIDDSKRGRALVGGLNRILHACLGPNGDVGDLRKK